MAAMTVTNKGRVVRGNEKVHYVDVTGPTLYTTGGETITAALLSALTEPGRVIGDILGFFSEHGTTGHTVCLDRTNSKILFFNGTTQIGAVDLTGVTIRVHVVYAVSNKGV